MRVLIVDSAYPRFLESLYASKPGLAERSYAEQWRALMDSFFGTADAYSHFLAPLGHPATELVVNCRPLQTAWAREHRLSQRRFGLPLGRRRGDEIVLSQVDEFEPDVVYSQNLSMLGTQTLHKIRRRGILLVGQIATSLPSEARLRCFDLIVSSFPHYVERLAERAMDTEFLRLAFDPRVLDVLGRVKPTLDVTFVGALGSSQWTHSMPVLERAARRMPIEFFGYKTEEWPPSSPIRQRYNGEAWGLDMYRALASSRVTLNRHTDPAEDHANNMRLYEATGVGALVLTDAKIDLHELFEPGRELVTYENEDELVERAQYLLGHEDERAAVARAGQERTLREHTWERRMRELADALLRRL
jgi:spore maturation protein CgeB